MPDFDAIARAIAAVAKAPHGQPEPVGGGCIHQAFRWGGYFVKANVPEQHPNFLAEATGLREIARTATLRVPEVIAAGRDPRQAFLVLEHFDLRGAGDEAGLGEQLARLHQVTGARYGFGGDNFIGATPQPNDWLDAWPAFFRERRIGHLLGLLGARGIEFPEAATFLARLPELLPSDPPAALLHGDLWGGNKAFLADGTPVVFDPAVHHGDPECDLAMTALFGGFGRRFHEAYRSLRPAPADVAARHEIYQLYHVLNHALLFGGGYLEQARRILRRYA
mgnify:FL=1